jgi:hypothetical protein
MSSVYKEEWHVVRHFDMFVGLRLIRGYTPMYHSLWVSVAANPHENDTRPTKATWGFKRLIAYAQCNRVPCESEEVFRFFRFLGF